MTQVYFRQGEAARKSSARYRCQLLAGDAQALDGLSADEMALDDLADIVGGDFAVPNTFGVNDDRGAELASVQASGFLRSDLLLDTAFFELLFEELHELLGAAFSAATPGVAGVAFVGADEDVRSELVHRDWHDGHATM